MASLILFYPLVSLLVYSSLSVTVFGLNLLNYPSTPYQKQRLIITTTPLNRNDNQEAEVGLPTYRVINSKHGNTCILFKADALVEVKFMRHNLEEQVDSFIPDKALVGGSCTGTDISNINLSWNGYNLVINFEKKSSGDLWHIKKVTLTVSPYHPQFMGINKYDTAIKLYHMKMLIPTPIGKSYFCEELEIPLETYKEENPLTGIHGNVLLRLVQLQPFMNNTETFESSVKCNTSENIGKKRIN
ncbi:hypothetical protein WA026_021676 [Henosepilachna vigintioctopunctata]|uniref:Lysosome-associated membrane glycoprotein 2-like luminal domain-containing protein n=1 Tax=Henosepilachna vigintioctopunctata TaxID=420089 RepID=A0AAW1U3K6_9CUCU